MFEAVELGRKASREEFHQAEPELHRAVLEAQMKLRTSDVPVIVILSGVEGAGRGQVTNRLSRWLDMRDVEVHSFDRLSEEEETYPEYWRFWRTLPHRGRISIFINSWYTDPLLDRSLDDGKLARFERRMGRINQFERMLSDDGALILKFWLHLTEKEQGERLKRLEQSKKTRWRVTEARLRRHEAYGKVVKAAETMIRMTDKPYAQWFLVESKNDRWRDLTVAQTLLDALKSRLTEPKPSVPERVVAVDSLPDTKAAQTTVLSAVDLSQQLSPEAYKTELDRETERVARLTRTAYKKKMSTVMVFEGWDAAGKGGAIRRVCRAVDARYTRTISIAAPTKEELSMHYLWRFWRDIPRPGHVSIYDRSWYGRVMVERIEGFATEAEWSRAYAEINQFEEQLVDHGIQLLKFWIHIDPDEQLARFKERQEVSYKRHKITEEDWRNRERWSDYEEAVNDMVAKTSTYYAPWHLVPGNDKRFARVTVLRLLRERLEAALKDD